MAAPAAALKRIVIGEPKDTQEYAHTLLPKWMAMPVFSSDPFSSVAYATEEMMLILALAGAGAFFLVGPLSVAVAFTLITVVISYRQTVRAYPNGGGAYIVAHDNLGEGPGLVAAAALLIDYSLTVAVSIANGVEQISSVFPTLSSFALPMALGFVAFVTLANLRGQKESGWLFAIPTYGFIASMLILVAFGTVRCLIGCPPAETAGHELPPHAALSLFLILHAFASGTTALTGIEAISNGVPAFRPPKGDNAATTLAIMAALAVTLFLGVSFLARATGVVATEEMARTVTAQIALAVFGPNIGFWTVQFFTVAILILAANTAYQDFPRLSAVLARDRYMPRQFASRGDRLAYSNGMVVLAVVASLFLIGFKADSNKLIQLYVVGVFTSFTLSQAGMVRRWWTRREGNWQRNMAVNAFGMTVTALALLIIVGTKFMSGAWIVVLATPIIAFMLHRIHRHYTQVGAELRQGTPKPTPPEGNQVMLAFDRLDGTVARGLSYARTVAGGSVKAFAIGDDDGDLRERWRELAGDVELEILDEDGDAVDKLEDRLVAQARERPGAFATVLIPQTAPGGWMDELLHDRLRLRLKARLLADTNLVVTNLVLPPEESQDMTVEEPVEHHVVVLVSAANHLTIRGLAYADELHPTSVRALYINLMDEDPSSILDDWEDWGITAPLELIESPYRSLSHSLRDYVRTFQPDGRRVVVTCIVPEFVAHHWYHQPLHAQASLVVKNTTLFEPGVVTTSVTYHLREEAVDPSAVNR